MGIIRRVGHFQPDQNHHWPNVLLGTAIDGGGSEAKMTRVTLTTAPLLFPFPTLKRAKLSDGDPQFLIKSQFDPPRIIFQYNCILLGNKHFVQTYLQPFTLKK